MMIYIRDNAKQYILFHLVLRLASFKSCKPSFHVESSFLVVTGDSERMDGLVLVFELILQP